MIHGKDGFFPHGNDVCLFCQHPDHLALGILNAHNAMVAGTYKHALGECHRSQDGHLTVTSWSIGHLPDGLLAVWS